MPMQYSDEDRKIFPAVEHFFFPQVDDYVKEVIEPSIPQTSPEFLHLAESFKKNLYGVICTAAMPFRIVSANHNWWKTRWLVITRGKNPYVEARNLLISLKKKNLRLP